MQFFQYTKVITNFRWCDDKKKQLGVKGHEFDSDKVTKAYVDDNY